MTKRLLISLTIGTSLSPSSITSNSLPLETGADVKYAFTLQKNNEYMLNFSTLSADSVDVYIYMESNSGNGGQKTELLLNALPENVHLYIYGEKNTTVNISNTDSVKGSIYCENLNISNAADVTFEYVQPLDTSIYSIDDGGPVGTDYKWKFVKYMDIVE